MGYSVFIVGLSLCHKPERAIKLLQVGLAEMRMPEPGYISLHFAIVRVISSCPRPVPLTSAAVTTLPIEA